jgi:hypothetical protein
VEVSRTPGRCMATSVRVAQEQQQGAVWVHSVVLVLLHNVSFFD